MNKKLLVFILVVLFVFTNVSAQTNTGYELALTAFSASASHIQHYESFTVTITPRNVGLIAFPGGEVGAALVDNNGRIAAVVGTRNRGALNAGSLSGALEFNCIVPHTVNPGRYQLRAVIRPTGGEWRLTTLALPNIPNSIDFEVRVNPNIVVAPLLQTKWGQGNPFNSMHPLAPGHAKANDRGELPTDCGVTQTVQLMAYHKHPIRGTGQSTVLGPHGITVPLLNFENYRFDWANMRNTYTTADPGTSQQRKAVAELNFIYAMAVTVSSGPVNILTNHFGYDRSIQRLPRKFYADAEWEAIIKQQLDAGLPLLYFSRSDSGVQHGFVIDGYDNSGRFHVNWGWNGSSDGWYYLNALTPNVHYNRDHDITINIKPDEKSFGSNEMGLEEFTITKNSVLQNEQFPVKFTISNFGILPSGNYGAALVRNGTITKIIGIGNINNWRLGTRTYTMNCFIPETVNTGDYSLRIVTRVEGGEWKIVTLSNRDARVPNAIPVTVTSGEANGGGYGRALTSFTTTAGSSVPQNELFTFTAGIRVVDTFDTFPGGQLSAALVNNNNEIVKVIGVLTNISPAGGTIANRNCYIPETVPASSYKLRIVIRPAISTGVFGDWRIATMSASPDIPTGYDITVTAGEANGGGYGCALTNFSTAKTSVSRNEQFSVSVGIRVIDPFDTFSGGQLSAALVNNKNEIVAVANRLINISPAGGSPNINNCSFPNTVPPGSYQLRIVIRPTVSAGVYGDWRIATMSASADVPTSIDFTVR